MNPIPEPAYHEPSERSTFLFAPEIETALVALCWRQPDRLAQVKRELDPAVHFVQPALRYLLEAIDLAYRELAEVDFACVIQVLRDLGRLEDAGGLEGVNEIYRGGEFLDSPVWQATGKTDVLFNEYLGMLKTYAVNRMQDPPRPTYRFTDGKGTMMPNKVKRHESDPDFTGQARVRGHFYSVSAWMAADGSFVNFHLQPTP